MTTSCKCAIETVAIFELEYQMNFIVYKAISRDVKETLDGHLYAEVSIFILFISFYYYFILLKSGGLIELYIVSFCLLYIRFVIVRYWTK